MNDTQLLVSVITIARNSRAFIGETIRSVVDQDYARIEYIVVDGASTDGTVDVINTYKANIAKFVSEPDNGIADAFNKGLRLATGDYILFLNSDDRLASPRVISDMVQAITAADSPDLIYGDCSLIERESGRQLYIASIDFSPRGFRLGRTLPHPSLFTSRVYFDRHGEFDIQFKIAMDYEFLLRGALQTRVVHVPITVTEVRTGGISTRSPVVVDEIVRALRKNRIIRTWFGAALLISYFRVRSLLRRIREMLYSFRSAPET
jgi:glycosyltransferase